MAEELFTKLRYCFMAGYTLPQYCIDNGIKKPLFVSEKKYELFLGEVHYQFDYDKRLHAQFCITDENGNSTQTYAYDGFNTRLQVKKLSEVNLNDFDKIIFLTKEIPKVNIKNFIDINALLYNLIVKAYLDVPLLKFLQRYPKVKLFLTSFPSIQRFKGGMEFNSQLRWDGPWKKIIQDDKNGSIETPWDKFGYTKSQVLDILNASLNLVKTNIDGSTELIADDLNPFRGVHNGRRVTAYQPEHFKNRIYIVGTCHHYGALAPFDKTIASYLQQMLNENNLSYRVENEGQCYAERYHDIFYNLNKLNPAPGDIIFVYIYNLHSTNDVIPFCDVIDAFDPPHDFREIYCVPKHVNELGYKLVAERYFKFLTENNFFHNVEFNYPAPPPAQHRYGIPPWVEQGGVNTPINEELETYKQSLRPKKLPVGALVMNCNPFTLGHLHLVEYAAAKVVRLYIFVVEEDKSEFPFADRIELVRQGVKNFSNVEVLPSGKFIISQQTFSGYFNKASLQDVAVDSSEDVEIFGKEIAPTLGITVRFAGEEPKDNVTRQYNETMKKVLPRYGIEFCEIPRKEFSGEPISASTVREAIKNDDFNKVKSLVPTTTFDYLYKRQHPEFFTAIMDIKLVTTTGDFQILSVSDDKASVDKPACFQTSGIGYQIQSCARKLEFVAKATVDGQIWLNLLTMEFATIDYTKLTIDDEPIINELTPVCCNKPYFYNMATKADAEIKIQVEWLPHRDDT